jgi:hypothetical protein
MTERMASVLLDVRHATEDGSWFRARSSGERVTLAALWRHRRLRRRVWRHGKSTADDAHEYRPA